MARHTLFFTKNAAAYCARFAHGHLKYIVLGRLHHLRAVAEGVQTICQALRNLICNFDYWISRKMGVTRCCLRLRVAQ